MVAVIEWPPIGLTGWELTKDYPVSRSPDFFGRPSHASSAGRPRYSARAMVPGIGPDRMTAGWLEMLRDTMGRNDTIFVRIPSMAPVWHLARRGQALATALMEWTSGGKELLWTASDDHLIWSEGDIVYGTPATDGGWPAVRVTGLPPRVQIAPSEFVTVTGNGASQVRRVLMPAKANGSGEVTIRLDDTLTTKGVVSIGEHRGLVFEVTDAPSEMQPVRGDWSYTWSFRQAFEDEVRGGFSFVNPWIPTVKLPQPLTFGSKDVRWGSDEYTFGSAVYIPE